MGADIVNVVDGKFSGRSFIHLPYGDWADLRAEIVRLRDDNLRQANAMYADGMASELMDIAPAEAKGDACPRCRGTGETCTGTIDGIPELFDCRDCLGSGMFTAPVGATIADAASDPSLTLDAARQLLRDVAHAIESGRYNTPQPAGGEAVADVVLHDGLLYGRLRGDLPVGTKLYTTPAAVPAGEAVAWLASDGEVFTDKESADRHSKIWGVNPLLTPLYTTPPAPVQAAPQEGEGYYLASFKHKANNGEVMWWKGDNAGYSPDLEQAGIYTELVPGYHDSEDTVPVPVAFLAGLRVRRTVDPSDSLNHMFWSAKTLRAALQHRGDSRGGEVGHG